MERPALARLLNYRWQHHCHGRFFHNRIVCSYLWHNLREKVNKIMLCSTPTLLIYKIIASGRHFVQLINKIMPNTNALSRLPIGLCRCLQNVNKPCSEVLLLCSPMHMHTHSPSPIHLLSLSSCMPITHDAGIHASLITRVPAFVHSTMRRGLPCRSGDKNDADDRLIAIAHSCSLKI